MIAGVPMAETITIQNRQVTETITLTVTLRAFVRKETKQRWVAVCPALGVASQGIDAEDAKRSVREAVELWFESCVERGVLDQALREANFRPLPSGELPLDGREHVLVDATQDIRGDLFPVNITIPAYQAAAFLSASV
jgi:predicted RNase H-like HicB family nuclease